MKDDFKLNQVQINFAKREDEKGVYFDVYAIEPASPLYYPCSDTAEAVQMFSKWLENTLNAMQRNNAKCLMLNCSWK